MPSFPKRRTDALHKGRQSLAGARYFVTCAAARPQGALTGTACARSIASALWRLDDDGDIHLLCATIMPDHLHALFVLTDRLSVGQVVGKFKACTRSALSEKGAKWQRDFFEHRLRPDDAANHFARYVFLNPYRAGLIARRAEWSFWLRKADVDFDFLSMLDDGRFPPAEWLTLGTAQLGLQADRIGE